MRTICRIWQRLKAIRRLGKIEECRKQRIALEEYCARINEKYAEEYCDEEYYDEDEDCGSFCSGGDICGENAIEIYRREMEFNSTCDSDPALIEEWYSIWHENAILQRRANMVSRFRGISGPTVYRFNPCFNPYTGLMDYCNYTPEQVTDEELDKYDKAFYELLILDSRNRYLPWQEVLMS